MAIYRADLVEKVQQTLKRTCGEAVSKMVAEFAVDAVLNAIKEGVNEHGKVKLTGFGNFEKVERKGRQGVHPQTKERISIEPYKSVRFTVSGLFKDLLK